MTEERASNSTPNDAPPEEDPRPDGLRSAKSLLLVNTGDGKGKSSAAFGVAMRARARAVSYTHLTLPTTDRG